MGYKRSISIGIGLLFIILLVSSITFYMSMGPCPKGSFSCDNATNCVPQKRICNSHVDCKDGTDEDRSECGMFHGATRLSDGIMKRVVASRNESLENGNNYDILSIGCVVKYFPKKCQCHNSKIFCGSNSLDTVNLQQNLQISKEVTHLLIKGPVLNNVNKNFLQRFNLNYLSFKYNNISSIPLELLKNQLNLQKLYICYNLIETLPNGIFKGLTKLQWLFLNSNNLKSFSLNKNLIDLPQLMWLNLTENNLTLENDYFPNLGNLSEIFLDFNNISRIEQNTFAELESLEHLSLAYNHIKYIDPKAFVNLLNLKALRLNGNELKTLSNKIFINNRQMEVLYLSHTSLSITTDLLENLNLSYLNLQGIKFESIDFQAIENLKNLQYIIYDKFFFCSMTPNIKKCKPNTDGISSFEDLLTKPVLRYSAWMMAILTLIGNMLVLWGRYIFRDENRAVTMVIRNLAVSDILMGFYLFAIGIQDFRFRKRYHEVAQDWISSWSCAGVGVLAVTSSEVSMLILAFMSLERFLLIADPFNGHRRLNSKNVSTCLTIIWIFGGCIAVAPVFMWHSSTRFYGTHSGTCFPLHIQERYPLGWQYSAFMFLGLNLFLLVMIALLYSALLISIWRTRRATPLAILDCEFAIRFFFIVLTDVTCWAPIIFMKIWAFLSYDISDDTYAWLVVFILPLNSAVNPLLYTFTTPKYRNQILLRGWKKVTSRRKTEGSATASNPDEFQGKVIPLLYQNANSKHNWKL